MPRAQDRELWLDPTKWKRTERFTVLSARPDGQLRVEIYASRGMLPIARVWAQVWHRTSTEDGRQDFVPGDVVIAYEVDLTSPLTQLIEWREKQAAQRGWRGMLDRTLDHLFGAR